MDPPKGKQKQKQNTGNGDEIFENMEKQGGTKSEQVLEFKNCQQV